MNRIEAALKMARMGWPVFPLIPGGRLPYAGEGVSVATTKAGKIRAWFATRPTMNYGVCTTGGVVIDIDQKGDKTGLANYRAEFGDIPETFTVATPNGGLHLYFEHDGCGQSPLCEHVDVRSFNGYVVGPGSEVGAGVYRIKRDVAPGRPPQKVNERLSRVPRALHDDPTERQAPVGELDTARALDAGKRFLLTDAPSGDIGGRNETGYRVACALKDLGISAEAIGDLMAEHWDVQLTQDFGLDQLYELGRRAHKSGQNRPGIRSAEADFAGLDIDAALAKALGADTETLDDILGEAGPAQTENNPLTELRQHAATWFEPFDPFVQPETLAPRRWFVPDFLMPGHVTGLVAAPGVGKSTLALTAAVGLAAGNLSALGMDCPEGAKRVLFLSTEEDRTETTKRAWAAMQQLGLGEDPGAIGDRLIIPGDKFDGVTLLRREKNGLVEGIDAQALTVICHDLGIDVLILDPWIEASDAEENSNVEVKQAITLVRQLCRHRQMAGLVIHHSRKAGSSEGAGDANITRGAGALNGALRANYTLVRPAADDMAAMGLSEDEAAAVFRMDRAKGSYSAPGKATRWFRTVSVGKPNADGTEEPIGAIERFDMAKQADETRNRVARILGALLVLDITEDAPSLTLKEAVDVLKADEIFGVASPAKIKAMLEGIFKGGTPALSDAGVLRLRTYGQHRRFELDRDAGASGAPN